MVVRMLMITLMMTTTAIICDRPGDSTDDNDNDSDNDDDDDSDHNNKHDSAGDGDTRFKEDGYENR